MIVRELITVLGFRANKAQLAAVERRVAQLEGRLKGTARAAQGAQSSLGRLARRFLGVTAAIGGLRAVLRINTEFERMGAMLETVTGSSEAAAEAMSSITDLTRETPFQLANVTEAFTTYAAMGLDSSTEALRATGDMASAFGKDITQATQAIRSASVGITRPLRQFGIVARTTGNQVSFTFRGITTTVANDSATIQAHLLEMARTNFGGGMERQMRTLGGSWSNLKDNLTLFVVALGQSGLNDAFRELVGLLRDTVAGGQSTAVILGRTMAAGVRGLTKVLGFLIEHAKVIKIALLALGGFAVVSGLTWLIGALGAVALAAKGMALAFLGAQGALVALVVGIPLLIQDFATFVNGGDSLIGRFVERFRGQDGLLGAFADFLDYVKNDLWPQFQAWWEEFRATTWVTIQAVGGYMMDMLGAVGRFVRGLADDLMSLKDLADAVGGAASLHDYEEQHADLGAQVMARRSTLIQAQRMTRAAGHSPEMEAQMLEALDVRTDPELQRLRSGMRALEEDQARVANANERIEERMTQGSGLIGQATRESRGITDEDMRSSPIDLSLAPLPGLNVGSVNVSIEGSTDMSAPEVSEAVAAGVEAGMEPALNAAERSQPDQATTF